MAEKVIKEQAIICFAFLLKTPLYDKIMEGTCEGGLYNGYVAFSDILPYDNTFYWLDHLEDGQPDPIDRYLDVHGGITFDSIQNSNAMYMIPLTEIPHPDNFKGLRVIGFDTLHFDDTKEEWDFENVKKETLKLYNQVLELLHTK